MLIFSQISSFSQIVVKNIERMRISLCGDSLVPQAYEFVSKNKRVYLISPLLNYYDIKGEKYSRRVKLNKNKRKEIFKCLYHLEIINLDQIKNKELKSKYFVLTLFFFDNTSNKFLIQQDSMTPTLLKLFNTNIE